MKTTLADEIFYYLFREIAMLRLAPGAKLSEAGLSRQFECSRIPVREAVQRLVAEDALVVLPQKGSFVTRIDLKRMEEIRYIREVMESRVVLDAFDADVLDSVLPLLESLIERQKTAINTGDYEQLFALDHDFHRIFYTIADKEFVLERTGDEDIHYRRARLLSLRAEMKSVVIEQHVNILDKIRKKDREGLELALTSHFRNVRGVLKNEIFENGVYRDYFVENN